MDAKQRLEFYSKIFDYVEIDSTFYRIPNRFLAIKWSKVTPGYFRYTAKFPKSITFDKRLAAAQEEYDEFFESMRPIKEKLLALLIQLPPSLSAKEGLKRLESIVIPSLSRDYRYAIEFRHPSWFSKDVYKLLSKHEICLVWSQLDSIQTPSQITTDFFYLRLIGNRGIDAKHFGKIQTARNAEIQKWALKLSGLNEKKIKFGIVVATNDYKGFGPATANTVRRMMGFSEAKWNEKG